MHLPPFALMTLCSLALLAGCAKKEETAQVQLYEAGRDKPIVIVVPVIDHSGAHLDWNLGEEMTLALQQRLATSNQFYILAPHKVQTAMKQMHANYNPFGADVSWIKRTFKEGEFITFVEFIEHAERPLHAKNREIDRNTSTELQTTVRLRVFDLRGEEPEVVLQELVHTAYYIPKPFNSINFTQVPWGEKYFEISPMGLAHSQLTKEIASRIQDYVALRE